MQGVSIYRFSYRKAFDKYQSSAEKQKACPYRYLTICCACHAIRSPRPIPSHTTPNTKIPLSSPPPPPLPSLHPTRPTHPNPTRSSHFPPPLVKLCHICPMNPGLMLCSWKLWRRASAIASEELRFWDVRPANLPEEAEDWCGLD